jgi:hypothetical protein
MVEFGLKLEDNKVADWSDYYIAYEKLKAILKRHQAIRDRYNELAARKPADAYAMERAYRQGVRTPYASRDNLLATESYDNHNNTTTAPPPSTTTTATKPSTTTTGTASLRNDALASIAESNADSVDEQSQLLSPSQRKPDASIPPPPPSPLSVSVDHQPPFTPAGASYGSTNNTVGDTDTDAPSQQHGPEPPPSLPTTPNQLLQPPPIQQSSSLRRSESGSSMITRAFEKAASGVTDYFNRSYERQLRDALKDMDAQADDFDQQLRHNRNVVNRFYDEKLQELEARLAFLRESVAQSRQAGTLPPAPVGTPSLDEELPQHGPNNDRLETPLVSRQRRKSSTAVAMEAAKGFARKIQQNLHPHGGSITDGSPAPTRFSDSQQTHRRRISESALPILTAAEHDDMDEEGYSQSRDEPKAKKIREVESIQRALIDMYRTAKLLHNFAIMNYTGFVKIVKKHDKTIPERKKRFHKFVAPKHVCNEGQAVELLTTRMETLYANWFCDRNVSEARAQMLPKRGDGLEMDWSQLRLGYRMGMCSVLGLWVCWDCIWGMISEGRSTIGGRTAFPVFRACGGLLTLQWFWGISTWVWSRYRINYIYLFDFNPQIVDSPLGIFNEAVDNTLVFCVGMLLYYKAGAHDIPGSFPAGIFPLLVVLYTIYRLIFPLQTRLPMWRSIWCVVTSPAVSPSFYHGYVGDIFTSMVKVFQDLAWTFFFFASGDWLISEDSSKSTKHKWAKTTWYAHILIPLLTLLPLWFRFNQCLRRYADSGDRFPHLANAFKYALSQTVTLFGAFHPLYMRNQLEASVFQYFWTFTFVSSSLYSFFWDVYMDWGLGRRKHKFLGPRLMYPKRGMYYLIIAVDLVLRFAWVLTLVPPQSGASFALPQYLTAVSMLLELFRRTIWGFLRLENEHRSNTAGFRRVGFVPLHFTTGHTHGHKEKEHRGFSVLIEVTVVTLLVVAACVVSVVAAQHATERVERSMTDRDL